jgi:hypothetical protein
LALSMYFIILNQLKALNKIYEILIEKQS